MASPAKIGIVTVSDRASAGIYADEGGPAILDYFSKALASPWQAVTRVIPD
jgi:molybdopterin adenylyltransferase